MNSFEEFLDRVEKISDENHILKNNVNNKIYLNRMHQLLMELEKVTSKKQVDDFLDSKLLFKQKFNLNTYMQGIVEFAVCTGCNHAYPDKFIYEKSYSGKTNVDCSFEFNNIVEAHRTINVEVKCPSYGANERKKIVTLNRLTDEQYRNLIRNPELKKRRDLRLKEYLQSAQKKFEQTPNDHINILLIGLDNEVDMMEWMHYLIASEDGMIRCPEVYGIKFQDFNRVDAVFITDLYIRHKDPKKIFCILGESYTFGISNDESKLNKVLKEVDLDDKSNFLKNSTEFQKYNLIILSELFNNLMCDFINFSSSKNNYWEKEVALLNFIQEKNSYLKKYF